MGTRILLVDDHAAIRTAMKRLLADNRFDLVAEAASGREALESLAKLTPDVVLMDVGLPDMRGVEVASVIRKQFPTVKVLMLSSYGDRAIASAALDAGARGFVRKDMAFDELALALTTIMEGKTYISPSIGPID
jgi:DNA-binding NarL/FixJ family response regulator